MERLKILRQYFNLTQTEFANRIKLNQSYYSQIEGGKKKLNDRIAKIICDEFSVNESWLRDGVGDMLANDRPESVGATIFNALTPEKQDFALSVLKNLLALQEAEEAASRGQN